MAPEELEIPGLQYHLTHVKIVETGGKISYGQTVRFPVTYSQGWKYIMVLQYCGSNAILADPLKSCAESELLREITSLYKHITGRGLQPHLHILDNTCSSGVIIFILSADAHHQLVPPGLHRALVYEWEIQTFKHHLIAGLSSCNPKFPLNLWCRLIRQAVLTLNLLYPSKLNLWLFDEAVLNRAFDFNQTPLVPPRNQSPHFEGSGDHHTFSHNRVEEWYLGPDPEHYICYTVYVL